MALLWIIILNAWRKRHLGINLDLNESKIYIQHFLSIAHSLFCFQNEISAYKDAVVILLKELADSDDEKPRWGKIRERIKRRRESGYRTYFRVKGWRPNGLQRYVKNISKNIFKDIPHECHWLGVLFESNFRPHFTE